MSSDAKCLEVYSIQSTANGARCPEQKQPDLNSSRECVGEQFKKMKPEPNKKFAVTLNRLRAVLRDLACRR